MPAGYLQVDKTGAIKDENNREIILRGINLDGGSKLPVQQTSFFEKVDDSYWDGDNISFVNRPFLLEDAPTHFAKLKSYGFNTIRYVFTWEALEHKGPGIYDDEFIDFTIKVLKILDEFGFYVFMDPHQDNVRIPDTIFPNQFLTVFYRNSGRDTVEEAEPHYGPITQWAWIREHLRLHKPVWFRVITKTLKVIQRCFGQQITPDWPVRQLSLCLMQASILPPMPLSTARISSFIYKIIYLMHCLISIVGS